MLAALGAAVLLVAAATSNSSISPEALDYDAECTAEESGACTLNMLQTRNGKSRNLSLNLNRFGLSKKAPLNQPMKELWHQTRKFLNSGDFDAVVDHTLNHFFSQVKGPGTFLEQGIKLDATWEKCTAVSYNGSYNLFKNYTFDHVLADVDVFDIFKNFTPVGHFGIEDMCGDSGFAKHDPSCYSVKAAMYSSFVLRKAMPDNGVYPKFANYSVVNWGQHPSWHPGAVADVNMSATPPSARLVDPKGVVAYSNCDLARTLWTQSPNQYSTGTCSYTAPLAALARRAPAYLAKLALRTLWTGRPSSLMPAACPYVYQQQPGLIPFQQNGKTYPPGFTGSTTAQCTSDKSTCEQSSGPIQAPGTQTMWTQTLMSSWVRNSWNGCDDEDQPKVYLNFPGQSKARLTEADSVQAGNLASMLWVCQRVIDPQGKSCRAIFNYDICAVSNTDCYDVLTFPLETSLMDKFDDAKSPSEKQELMQRYPILVKYDEMMKRVKGNNPDVKDKDISPYASMDTTFTKELLQQACAANVAMFIIAADALLLALNSKEELEQLRKARLPYYGQAGRDEFASGCDHVVFLDNCNEDRNEYRVWTWGLMVTLSREMLLGVPVSRNQTSRSNTTFNSGMVCSAVVAHQVTME
eukprot:TRINITY_DN25943_c0_g1_i1.p1 TRINITY_DN25943_c0_g1~~TRINITY_DN25943_c0_g1_i1.p1  ORF type:complete len:636 (+),score=91.64 TRINITY_DN25943_c0_g1_i1:95-2002(+)